MPNVEDQVYGEWLKLINIKLDEILRMLTLQREGFSTLPFKQVNISGNGMSFFSPDALAKGTIIEARVVLTTLYSVALFLYGEVITGEPAENGWTIGFRFINLDDLIRNEIIRFVFEREREVIREKRGI
jgi:c-di-GMP-binding flagellar brake protein YcgR